MPGINAGSPFDLFAASIAAKKLEVEKSLAAARPLLTEAPDSRTATSTSYADPTADVALHPARMAVASAYVPAAELLRALSIVARSEHLLNNLDEAVAEWHGDSPSFDLGGL